MVHSSLETFHFFLFVSLSIHFTIMFLVLKFLIFHALSFCNPLNLKFSILFQLGKFLGIIAWNSSSSVKWHPTPVPLPGKSHERRSLVGYSPWGRKESDTTEQLHFNHFILYHWRRKWQPTPVFLPGESHERRSLVGYSPQGRKELDTTEWLHFLSLFSKIKSCTSFLWFEGAKEKLWAISQFSL